jgi:predicted metal-dependent hydrolase
MASTTSIIIEGVGEVEIIRHAMAKKLRLSFTRSGEPRVTIPKWAPFKAGEAFAKQHADWIMEHRPAIQHSILHQGQHIGKSGTLVFVEDPSRSLPISRIKQMAISITIPPNSQTNPDVQAVAHKACERYLRVEAEQLLPGRLHQLAQKHDIAYKSVSVKRLQARWGSCSSSKDIVLNYFLMQLPWHLIDYVLLHELNHIQHMHHGTEFWAELGRLIPDLTERRKAMRACKPAL